MLKEKTINNNIKQSKMVNYQNGKIYKIEDVGGNMCYIGATTKQYLSYRISEHRSAYNRWLIDRKAKSMVYEIFDKYGVENCRIVLIELCPCDTKDELARREVHFIRLSQCVNKYIPMRTDKQYYEDNREELLKKKSDYYYKQEKHVCICGTTFTYSYKSHHMKTKKHLDKIANIPLDV